MKATARVATPIGRIAIVFALLLIALGTPAGARAAQTHVFSFSAAEFLDDAQSVAVDQSSGPTAGQIWIGNGNTGAYANPFVTIFDSTGNGVLQLAPATPFAIPKAIATDNSGGPSDGDFYIGDAGNQKIYKYGPDGTMIWEVDLKDLPGTYNPELSEYHPGRITGLAVDPLTGQIFVEVFNEFTLGNNSSSQIYVLGEDGSFVQSFGVTLNSDFAQSTMVVNGAGHVLTRRGGQFAQGELLEYASDGTLLGSHPEMGLGLQGLAYDAADGQYVANKGTEIDIYNSAFEKIDHFGIGVLEEGTAVAVNESTGVVYALDRRNGSTEGRLDVFSPAALPNLATGPVTGIAKEEATLNGTVEPAGGGEVTVCEFEYGSSSAYGQTAPCAPAVPYASNTTVSAALTGLSPATEYHYRLTAGNANGSARQEEDHTFITAPGAPQLLSETVGDLGSDNARVDSSILVLGADARITVEYGTSTAYGSSAPVGGRLSAASGPTDQAARTVPVQLTGLALDTTYHYRVVVSNSAGTTTGTDQVFHTFAAPENQLPDGRGYELVTPINKNAHQIIHEYGIATDNGQGVLYPATLSIGETATGGQSFGVARRVNGQWISDSPYVRPDQVDIQHYPIGFWPSDDLSGLAFSGQGFTSEGDFFGLFLSTRTSTSRISAGSLDPAVVGPSIVPETAWPLGKLSVAGASPDLSSVYFGYDGALLTQDGVRTSALASKDASGFYVYEDGQLLPADLLPDGTLDPEGAAPAATPSVFDSHLGAYRKPTEFLNQVSQDGDRAFFVSPAPSAHSVRPAELYVHRKGRSSLLVSRSSLSGGPAATGAVQMAAIFLNVEGSFSNESDSPYAAASRDGSHVVFESRDRLTSDAPEDASIKSYLFDVDSETLIYLPGVSGTAIGVANDGTRVYFVEGEELSLWEAGSGVRDVATGSRVFNNAAITPDGSTIVFSPVTPLGGFNTGGQTQVYRYDAARRSLDCISCAKEGASVTAGSYLAGERRFNNGGAPTGELKSPHFITTDGNRVFFETAQALVTADTNQATDVYEWEGGRVHLISGGKGKESTFLVDNSASGDDVFFVTEEGLVAEDRDGSNDVYDARVGAGTDTNPVGGCGGHCQGETKGAPASSLIGTESLTAAGPAGKTRTVRVQRWKVSGSKVHIAVSAPEAGKLWVTGRGIEPVSRKVAKAGAYEMTVSLSKKARQKLAEERGFATKIKIKFRPAHGEPSVAGVSLTFKD